MPKLNNFLITIIILINSCQKLVRTNQIVPFDCPFQSAITSCKTFSYYGKACDVYCHSLEWPQRGLFKINHINNLHFYSLNQTIPDDGLNGLIVENLRFDSLVAINTNSLRNLTVYNLYLNSTKFGSFQARSLVHLENTTRSLHLHRVHSNVIQKNISEINRLKQLNELRLDSNSFSRIDSNLLFRNLKNLATLFISNQPISRNSLQINDLNELRALNLTNLGLSELNSRMIYNLPKLVLLDLSNNRLTRIESNWLPNSNKSLNFLMLENNQLKRVPNLLNFTNLNYLNLANQNGQLTHLNNYAFQRHLNDDQDDDGEYYNQNRFNNTSQIDEPAASLIINISNNSIEHFYPRAFCNRYYFSLSKQSLFVYLDDLNKLPSKCMLKQFRTVEESYLFINKNDLSCELKAYALNNGLKVFDVRNFPPETLNFNDNCLEHEENFKYICPPIDLTKRRYSTWITGVSHLNSFRKKLENCMFTSENVCLRNSKMTIYCTYDIKRPGYTLLSQIKVEFSTRINNTLIFYYSNQTHLANAFQFGQRQIEIVQDKNGKEWLKIIRISANTRLIFDYEQSLSIALDRLNQHYTLVVRSQPSLFLNSIGVLSDGCNQSTIVRPMLKSFHKNAFSNHLIAKAQEKEENENICTNQCRNITSSLLLSNNKEIFRQSHALNVCQFDCNINNTLIEFVKRAIRASSYSNNLDMTLNLNDPLSIYYSNKLDYYDDFYQLVKSSSSISFNKFYLSIFYLLLLLMLLFIDSIQIGIF